MDPRARRLVYYVAMSADGFIARPDGSVDWLESRPAADYDAVTFFARIDTIVWGRTTFDHYGRKHGLEPFGAGMRHIVLTHHPERAAPMAGVTFTSTPIAQLAKQLRGEPGKDVWIMGGADSAASILEAGELDEIHVHVIPVLLREGIPLLRAGTGDAQLRIRDSHAYPDGVVRLHYDVIPDGNNPRLLENVGKKVNH